MTLVHCSHYCVFSLTENPEQRCPRCSVHMLCRCHHCLLLHGALRPFFLFSIETSEKVFVPLLLSGVPVATNWDA